MLKAVCSSSKNTETWNTGTPEHPGISQNILEHHLKPGTPPKKWNNLQKYLEHLRNQEKCKI